MLAETMSPAAAVPVFDTDDSRATTTLLPNPVRVAGRDFDAPLVRASANALASDQAWPRARPDGRRSVFPALFATRV